MDPEQQVAQQVRDRLQAEMQAISDRLSEMARIAAEHGLLDPEVQIGAVGVHAANVADLMSLN